MAIRMHCTAYLDRLRQFSMRHGTRFWANDPSRRASLDTVETVKVLSLKPVEKRP